MPFEEVAFCPCIPAILVFSCSTFCRSNVVDSSVKLRHIVLTQVPLNCRSANSIFEWRAKISIFFDLCSVMPNLTETDKQTLKLHSLIALGDVTKGIRLIQPLPPTAKKDLTRGSEKLGLVPALFTALYYNDLNFTKFLLEICNADIEERMSNEGSFGYNSSSEMTPLEFAYFRNQGEIFDFLLLSGADARRLIQDKKLSIGVCKMTSVSIEALRRLRNLGVDFTSCDDDGFSCLMHSVQSVSRMQFLLLEGVNVHATNRSGDTALHLAVMSKSLSSVKLLVEHGSNAYAENFEGYDALHCACLARSEVILKYFLQEVSVPLTRQMECFQMFGDQLQAHESSTESVIKWWRKAVCLRVEHQFQITAATLDTPFGRAVEVTSFAELETLPDNPNLMTRQSLVLNHKLFGKSHDRFFRSIALCAASYYRTQLFEQWVQVITYWLSNVSDSTLTQAERSSQINRIQSNLTWRLRNLFGLQVKFEFSLVFGLAEAVTHAVRKCRQLENGDCLGKIISSVIIPYFSDTYENGQTSMLRQTIRSAIKEMYSQPGSAIVTNAVYIWAECDSALSEFPVHDAFTMLLECGADVDEVDPDGNTVVHLMRQHQTPANIIRLRKIAAKFVEFGIHPDFRNRAGVTTTESLQHLGIKTPPEPARLKCLAARAILQHKLPMKGILPKILIEFVEMH